MALFLVTGATDGIGKQTAIELAKTGGTVLVHGRTVAKAEAAIKSLGKGNFEPFGADLSSMAEVRALADAVLKRHSIIDVLINNAGVYMHERKLTVDGFEQTMAVNHFSHFILTHQLLPALRAAPQGRIVHVSSMAHQRGKIDLEDLTFARHFDGYGVYAASKLANVWFSNELARRLKDSKVTSNSLHPGVITTKLLKSGFGSSGASLEEGAATSVYCATSPELDSISGAYFSDSRKANPSTLARDAEKGRAFYERSCELTSTPAV